MSSLSRHGSMLSQTLSAYWIAFGPHGPRALPPPGEGRKVFAYTIAGIAAAAVIFAVTRSFARPAPKTMNKEYQEMSDEYLKVQEHYQWQF